MLIGLLDMLTPIAMTVNSKKQEEALWHQVVVIRQTAQRTIEEPHDMTVIEQRIEKLREQLSAPADDTKENAS